MKRSKQDLRFLVTLNGHDFITDSIETAIMGKTEPQPLNRKSRRALASYTTKLLKGVK